MEALSEEKGFLAQGYGKRDIYIRLKYDTRSEKPGLDSSLLT